MEIVGLTGILAALVLFIILVYKNCVSYWAVLILFIFNGLCTMGGIDGYVGIFTMFPIYMLVCKKCDIPRRFLPGMMFLNCMFMAAPAAPQIHNVMAVAAMNAASASAAEEGAAPFFVNTTAGLVPGWICVVIIAILALTYMPFFHMKKSL